jgi:AcrR family transcriptional regulator
MARPRRNTDTEILVAAFRAIARLGPVKVTLADVAAEAGVTAASLVQRFGSKRALLLAAAADAAGGPVYIFTQLRAKHRSPIAALYGLADAMSVLGATPDEVARSLAFLQIDLTDRDFLEHAQASSLGFRAGILGLLRDARAEGLLRPCDITKLARALQSCLNGSLLDWTIHREGPMAAWVRQDLKTVLGPHLASSPGAGRR